MLAGGLAALVVALLLSTLVAGNGLPVWVQVVAVVLIVLGVAAAAVPKWLARWWVPTRAKFHLCLAGLGVGAVVLEAWALFAGIAEARFGVLGTALPVVAFGCVAVLVAAKLLAAAPRTPGVVARQVIPAIVGLVVALVAIGVLAGITAVVAPRITVDAATAERVDPAAVPDPSAGVRWTSNWPRADGERIQVVAAGAGVVVAAGDRVVAVDGATGAQRWHYRRPGARVVRLAASPDARTAVATFTAGDERDLTNSVFAFDANTGDVRWSRWPVSWSSAT